MITDPITLRAKPPGVRRRHRVLRGAGVSALFSTGEAGHQRDTAHPKGLEGFSEDHGLRLSQTLAHSPSGAALHRKEVTRGDAHGVHRSRLR